MFDIARRTLAEPTKLLDHYETGPHMTESDTGDSADRSDAFAPPAMVPLGQNPPLQQGHDDDVGRESDEPERPTSRTNRRGRRLAMFAALLAVAGLIVALGVFASGARSDANDEGERADAAEAEVARLTDDLADARSAASAAESATGDVESELDRARSELNRVSEELDASSARLSETQAALDTAQDLGVLATLDDLAEFRQDLDERWSRVATAESVGDLNADLVAFDRVYNRLVSTNVEPTAEVCKETLANNGYLNYILIASALTATLEAAPDDAAALQAEIVQFADARTDVYDDACR